MAQIYDLIDQTATDALQSSVLKAYRSAEGNLYYAAQPRLATTQIASAGPIGSVPGQAPVAPIAPIPGDANVSTGTDIDQLTDAQLMEMAQIDYQTENDAEDAAAAEAAQDAANPASNPMSDKLTPWENFTAGMGRMVEDAPNVPGRISEDLGTFGRGISEGMQDGLRNQDGSKVSLNPLGWLASLFGGASNRDSTNAKFPEPQTSVAEGGRGLSGDFNRSQAAEQAAEASYNAVMKGEVGGYGQGGGPSAGRHTNPDEPSARVGADKPGPGGIAAPEAPPQSFRKPTRKPTPPPGQNQDPEYDFAGKNTSLRAPPREGGHYDIGLDEAQEDAPLVQKPIEQEVAEIARTAYAGSDANPRETARDLYDDYGGSQRSERQVDAQIAEMKARKDARGYAAGGMVKKNYADGGTIREDVPALEEEGMVDRRPQEKPAPPEAGVADDLERNLSEGEFIIPAHVVEHFGPRFFEELLSSVPPPPEMEEALTTKPQ